MIHKTPPLLEGLNIRIPMIFPVNGRGFINGGVYITVDVRRTPPPCNSSRIRL